MPMVKMTIEVEFETNDAASARATAIRLPSDVSHAVRQGAGTMPTGVKGNSVKVEVTAKTIDGKPTF